MIAVYQEIFLKINLLTTTKVNTLCYYMVLQYKKNQCRKSNIKQSQELDLPQFFQALLNW